MTSFLTYLLHSGHTIIFSIDAVTNFLSIPKLPAVYPNVLSRESTTVVERETSEYESTYHVNEFNSLNDHEIYQLVVSLDSPPYDETKNIKLANLFGFFKIMNIIIDKINPLLNKTEINMDWTRFMIWVAHGMHINLEDISMLEFDISHTMFLVTRF